MILKCESICLITEQMYSYSFGVYIILHGFVFVSERNFQKGPWSKNRTYFNAWMSHKNQEQKALQASLGSVKVNSHNYTRTKREYM